MMVDWPKVVVVEVVSNLKVETTYFAAGLDVGYELKRGV